MKTTFELHKLPEGFIVTSDEKPLIKGGKVYNPNISKEYTKVDLRKEGEDRYSKGYHEMTGVYPHVPTINPIYEIERKVIAQQDQIDFSALSEEEQKEIGWFDVEKLAKEMLPDDSDWQRRFDIIKGFQKAQELLSDRVFTLEDMVSCFNAAREYRMKNVFTYDEAKDYIHSLSQKSWKVELEMEAFIETIGTSEFDFQEQDNIRPKLTNGKIKILELL